MADEKIIDLESMPLNELKALALKEAADNEAAARKIEAVNPKDDKKEQLRDDDGKFRAVAAEEYEEDEIKVAPRNKPIVPDPEVEEMEDGDVHVYTRTVKNADGSVDYYEAESLEELIDKIADGKENANRKIHQQEAELKDLRARTAEKPKPKEFTQDQEYVFSQKLAKNPTQAFREMFKELTGHEIEEFGTVAQREAVFAKAESTNNALASFMTSHPDYEDSVRNSEAMKLFMSGKEVTGENLHKGYLHLKQSRLLDLKGEEAHVDTDTKSKTTEPTVQPKTQVTQQRTKKGSGVKPTSRTAPVVNNEPSEDELYDSSKFSLAEIKRRADLQMAKQRNN